MARGSEAVAAIPAALSGRTAAAGRLALTARASTGGVGAAAAVVGRTGAAVGAGEVAAATGSTKCGAAAVAGPPGRIAPPDRSVLARTASMWAEAAVWTQLETVVALGRQYTSDEATLDHRSIIIMRSGDARLGREAHTRDRS
jgi:hypothetical protein